MLRLHVLGTVELWGAQSEELRSVLVQPKRLALFTYLALAQPRRLHRRDSLLGLFWPESDNERARLALRQSLHFLRRSLGDGVIVGRGDEEVGVGMDSLWCDAVAFEAALQQGRYVEALGWYRGDLLAGFFAPDVSPDVDQWLESERARLRARAASGAWSLSDAADRSGNGAEAAQWARNAVQYTPDDETALRRLVVLLDRWGDRAGALRAHGMFAQRLRQEFEVEPSAETRALIGVVRTRDKTNGYAVSAGTMEREDNRDDVGHLRPVATEATTVVHADGFAAATDARPRRRTRWWSGPRVAFAGTTLALAGLGTASLTTLNADKPAPLLAIGWISNEGGEGSEEAARLLPGLLATALSRVSGLRVVSQSRMMELMSETGRAVEAPHVYSEAARLAGATQLLEGSLYRRGDTLRLDVRRGELGRGVVGHSHSITGTDAFELADRATAEMARVLSLTAPALPLSASGVGSLVARRFYEEGLRAYFRGEWRPAYRLFSAALSEDSTFAMAAYYAGLSIRPFRTDSQFMLLEKASELARRAPERERLLIAFAHKWPDRAARAAIAESLAYRFPSEPEGLLALATIHIAAGDFGRSLPLLRRVIAMDSLSLRRSTALCRACDGFGALLSAYAAMGLDSLAAVERTAREWIALRPSSASPWLMLAKALAWRGRSGEALRAVHHAGQLEPQLAHMYEHASSVPALIFESAVIDGERYGDVERALRDRSRFAAGDQEATWWLVTSLRQQGRVAEALSVTRSATQVAASAGHTGAWVAVEAQLLFESGRFREAGQRFEHLSRTDAQNPFDPGNAAWRVSWSGVHTAMAWAAAGDTARLAELADSIERTGVRSARGLAWRLPHHVRGLLWQARGEPARAAEEFRAAIFSPTLGYTRTNLELARACLQLGRHDEAIAVLREALGGSSDGPAYALTRTEIHEGLARAFEAAGEPDSAAAHYRKVLEAWQFADPIYRERAEAARRHVETLERRSPTAPRRAPPANDHPPRHASVGGQQEAPLAHARSRTSTHPYIPI